jgi:hypothetical protein
LARIWQYDRRMNMIGWQAEKSGDVPRQSETKRAFERAEVAKLGKIRWYGSQALTMYVAELRDGTLMFLRVKDQGEEDQRWVERQGRKIHARQASRAVGYSLVWGEAL